MNPWIELLILVEEMRENQRAYFKDRNKVKLVKAQLSEVMVDQKVVSLKNLAKEKGINIEKPKPIEDEPTE